MMLTASGSNNSSIQFTDSEDLTENYPAGDQYTSDFLIGTLHFNSSTRNAKTVVYPGNDVTPRMSADWIVHNT